MEKDPLRLNVRLIPWVELPRRGDKVKVKSAATEPVWRSLAYVVILKASTESSLFMLCNLIVKKAG